MEAILESNGSNLGGCGSYIGGVILFECGSYIGAHPLLSTRSLPLWKLYWRGYTSIKLETTDKKCNWKLYWRGYII